MQNITNQTEDYPLVSRSLEVPSSISESWKKILASAVRDPKELLHLLELPPSLLPEAQRACELFPLVVPQPYLSRIEIGNPKDPLLLQVLPLGLEEHSPDGYTADPLGEDEALISPGVLQKYHGRALLVTTGICAIHCRYCFRRHFPYADSPRGIEAWKESLDRLRADSTITEVLLSGGDPLSLSDPQLSSLLKEIASIDHVERLRIHTRLPTVIPQRVTEELLNSLTSSPLKTVVVVHVNHHREIDDSCREALFKLSKVTSALLNQTVLLKGINDSSIELKRLSERLLECSVLPYYLHQLDPVIGAAHFQVPVENGRAIIEDLEANLPGYLVPKYVQELPGKKSKTRL